MSRKSSLVLTILLFISILFSACSQKAETIESGKDSYQIVKEDPLKARIYTLDNGLKVYLSVYKDAPRVYTAIAVRTGSKKDPAQFTGLAHYLEHLLFKGTQNFGTLDWTKEKVEIDKISDLFEVYRTTSDMQKRKAIYHKIDSISYVASGYAIPNEYDKMTQAIGSKGTNAFTSNEQTVYINDIPSNQMDKWLTIEKERFSDPIFRLFHTELEVVYEEKNRSLDSDSRKVRETLYAALFKKHQYGTQTTIGTIENLKNPSIKAVMEYFHKYYVPNNMAIVLSGDFDPDIVIEKIDSTFGQMKSKIVPKYTPPQEDPIEKHIEKTVLGPDAESVSIGFRFPGDHTPDADLLTITDMILSNSQAGLIDLNLNQKQKILGGTCYPGFLKDYSVHTFYGKPRQGQTLEEVKDLLLGQIDLVKNGEFPDWLPEAIINDLKLSEIRQLESNRSRVFTMVDNFIKNIPWQDEVFKLERLSRIHKADIMNFANHCYADNYVVVYKKVGKDTTVKKVKKPEITPVKANRDAQSEFVKNILTMPTKDIQPVFIDFNKEITKATLKNKAPILYRKNTENALFNLYYIADMGTDNDRRLGLALSYLNYLGTTKYTPEQIKQEFYKIGCSFSVSSGKDQVYVSLSGLQENFDAGLRLFEHLLKDAQVNPDAFNNLITDVLKKRKDSKLSKGNILWNAMMNYGKFGKKSSFTNILSEDELKSMQAKDLIDIIHGLTSHEHKIVYYGPTELNDLTEQLENDHQLPGTWTAIPTAQTYVEQKTARNRIYLVDYDMKQAEILMLSKKGIYNPEKAPLRNLFNEYYGGSMSSIVFQDMRETKALAYSVYASYQSPRKKSNSEYLLAYIGTQSDKLPEAMKHFIHLLNNMPKSDNSFEMAQKAIIKKIQTERITKASMIFRYLALQKLGIDYDIRKEVYEKVPSLTLNDIEAFFNKNIRGDHYNIMIIGDTKKLDKRALKKFGKIKTLSLEEIFAY